MSDFLQHAWRLTGPALEDESEIAAALEAREPAWVHLQADDPRSATWIETRLSYLPEPVRAALLAPETRPRLAVHGDGVLLILRGVNLNPGADPEDMVSIRIWADPSRIVTLSRRPLRSVADMADLIASGKGPDDAGAFLCVMIERLALRIADTVAAMDAEGDTLEEDVLRDAPAGLRLRITDLRADVVDFRRFLVPQREAIAALAATDLPMIEGPDRVRLEEAEDGHRRLVEVIEALRDRLVVVKDELASQNADRLNRNLYILSIVSVVFLPLGFLTGLLGVNVAGIPGADWPPAFWVFTAGLGVVLILQLVVLWFLRFTRTKG